MKDWEEMKDFSFVGIKLTKAKSISEGLTRCKIQKLTRKNPVYQHIQLHKKNSKATQCHICSPHSKSGPSLVIPKSKISTNNLSQQTKNSLQKRCKTVGAQRTEKIKKKFAIKIDIGNKYSKLYNNMLNETPKEKVFRSTTKISETLQRYGKGLKKDKGTFKKINDYYDSAENYFLTAINDIQLEINEDKGLSIRQVQTDTKRMIEQMREIETKRKERDNRVKELNKPVKFPLTPRQITNLMRENDVATTKNQSKINKMLHSLYDYKSCKNYSNRMKIISSVLNK